MTLTQAANLTRRGIITAIVLTILGVLGATGYKIWHQRQLASLPPALEKPEMKFGTLPKPLFPPSFVSSSNYSYSLDTVTGGLPQTPKLLKVYFIPQSSITLLAPEKSKQLAQNLGFISEPIVLSQTSYKFIDESGRQLIIDLTNNNFTFQKKEATSSSKLDNPSDKNKLVADFKNYLSSKNLLTAELGSGRSNVFFDEAQKTTIISFWPADLDNLPIVTTSLNQSLVKATLLSSDEQYSRIDYTFWLIDKTSSSTYPVKTAEKAFDDLKSGQGFISIEPQKPQVSLSLVYLAYFESEEYSPYLQPVFVFEGPDFAALVPAIATGN